MEMITTTDALAALCVRLATSPYITVDTEFMRENTYWPLLCLVQVASPDEAVIIDPLAAGISLQPLFELMQNPRVLKVFHAARQDVEIFCHLSGEVPTPLFDTQVAAMVCGFGEQVSYETLATQLAKAQIDKSSRFTDWSRRPLSERQLVYAQSDVTHLRIVYEKLARRLAKSNREDWLAEEVAILADPGTYAVQPADAWRRIKTRSSKPRFLAVLKELAAWREAEAQNRDLPRGRLLRDEALLEMAGDPPKSAEALARVRGLSRGIAEGRMGVDILAAIQRALSLPAEALPVPEAASALPRGVGPLVELLKVLLKAKCESNDVAQKLVASTADLERIAADDNANVPALRGWRYEIFGADAVALKAGRLALAAQRRQVKLVPLPEPAMAAPVESL
jgi:ribonuclease D